MLLKNRARQGKMHECDFSHAPRSMMILSLEAPAGGPWTALSVIVVRTLMMTTGIRVRFGFMHTSITGGLPHKQQSAVCQRNLVYSIETLTEVMTTWMIVLAMRRVTNVRNVLKIPVHGAWAVLLLHGPILHSTRERIVLSCYRI